MVVLIVSVVLIVTVYSYNNGAYAGDDVMVVMVVNVVAMVILVVIVV